jgi:hypothetical protein
MVQKPLRALAAIAFVSDLATVSAAYVLAYLLRFQLEIVPVTRGFAPLATYLNFLPVALALWFASSWVNGLYAPQRRLSRTEEFFSVTKAGSLATLLLISLTFFYREYTFSRVMLLLFWAASILLASSGRALIVIAVRIRRRRGINVSPALIVGAGELGQTIARSWGCASRASSTTCRLPRTRARPRSCRPCSGASTTCRSCCAPTASRTSSSRCRARSTCSSSAAWRSSTGRSSTSSSSPTSSSS